MKKIFLRTLYIVPLYFILSFLLASCGGNEPEQAAFTFTVEPLSTKAHVKITAVDKEAYFISDRGTKSAIEQAGGLQKFVENSIKNLSISDIGYCQADHESNFINLSPNTDYVIYAFYAKDDEKSQVQIVGKIASYEFKTLPEYTLPGLFSVSDTKQVRFASGNVKYESSTYGFFSKQYEYSNAKTGTTIDLFPWDDISAITNQWKEFSVLSADEWWFILKDRPQADELFAHATVNGKRGIILLPDNWQTPEGITLKTAKEMGMEWDETNIRYAVLSASYDGYAQNIYTASQWSTLEFAGAVFLPSGDNQGYGWYWSSSEKTSNSDLAHNFSFGPNNMSLLTLKGLAAYKNSLFLVRPVREVK